MALILLIVIGGGMAYMVARVLAMEKEEKEDESF